MTRSAWRSPSILFAAALVVLALAYQSRSPLALEMNASGEDVYLSGVYPPEQTFDVTFRWTDGDAQIDLPGAGSGVALKLALVLHEFRPSPLTPQPVHIDLNGRDVIRFTPDVQLAAYAFDLPPIDQLHGAVSLHLRSDVFVPRDAVPNSDDARPLGLFVDRVQLDFGAGLIAPPLWTWLLLALSVAAIFGLSRAIGLGTRPGVIASVVLLSAYVAAIAAARLWIGYHGWWIAVSIIGAWLIAARLRKAAVKEEGSVVSSAPRGLAYVLGVFLAWRVALIAVPIVGADVQGVRECCPEVLPAPVASWSDAAFNTWYRWDAIWYGRIARDGYQYAGQREASNVGFFPGAPLLFGAATRLTGLPVEVAGPIVSSILALMACWLLYRLTLNETGDGGAAQRSSVYLLAFPAAYYLGIGYSEALYVVAVLGAFYLARQGRWVWAGAIGFVAGLARLHGALLIAPLAYEYLRQNRWQWRSIFRPQIIGVLGAPLGVLAFNLYLNAAFGQPAGYFSPYFEVQTLFFKGVRAEAFPTFPLTTFFNYLGGLLNGAPSTESVAVMGALILLMILTVEVWARLPRVYGVYMLTVTLFSLVGGDLISMPRFVLPMFPGFMALALLGQRPALDRAILILSVILQGVLALMFTKGYWIA